MLICYVCVTTSEIGKVWTYGEEALEPSVTRKKTYDLLMNKALVLFEQGEIPSISRLATEAGVSRATAYRYFPTQSDLIAAAVGASLETLS